MNNTTTLPAAQQPFELAGVEWLNWQYRAPEGFLLRGIRTVPRGLPLLHFIHGNSYSGLTYLPLWQQLAPHFDLFLHDAQGHGDSEHGGKFVGWERSAQLAQLAWQDVAPEYASVPIIGVGHSFGGALTSLMSAADEQLFSQLVLLDPMLFPQPMIRWALPLGKIGLNPVARKARRRRMEWPDRVTALQSLQGRGMFAGWRPEAMAAYVEHAMADSAQGVILKCLPEREAEVFSTYAPTLWRQINRVSVPTVSFVGTDTYPFLHRSMRDWQRQHALLEVQPMAGGHCFMQEQPELTAQKMMAVMAPQYKPKG